MQELYRIKISLIVTYESLRSRKHDQPRHGLLTRIDELDTEHKKDEQSNHSGTNSGTNRVQFAATPLFLQMCDEGLLLVFDEIQKIKNNSAQQKACQALVEPMQQRREEQVQQLQQRCQQPVQSYLGMLSGTPFDKEEHCTNFLIAWIREITWISFYPGCGVVGKQDFKVWLQDN